MVGIPPIKMMIRAMVYEIAIATLVIMAIIVVIGSDVGVGRVRALHFGPVNYMTFAF